ncbi:hypothetical protein GCM10022239_22930 [Leifsonia bigeumensis]|uniref:DUF2510 domain-containing protein n=1 Tax=Leifsonella bigeumensis TaxID=433643 RepID=A0ABP7FSU5_9MICO
MSMDTASTVIIAGWYPDPADATQARWWDGSQWTPQTRPRHTPAPVQGNRYFSPVPIRTDATLPPIDPYRPMEKRHNTQGFVSMAAKPTIQYSPTRAYTGSVWWLATMPIWSTVLVMVLVVALGEFFSFFPQSLLTVLLLFTAVALTIHDRKVLLAAMHPTAASAWWFLLGPFIYLVVRSVHVTKNTGHGWAPVIVYLVSSIVPLAAILAFTSLYVFIASMMGAV